jgi:hypothetical protein
MLNVKYVHLDNSNKLKIDKEKLRFIRYSKQQRRVLAESIHRYPSLFECGDLVDYDATIKELYLYLGTNNLFSEFNYTPFKNHKDLFKFVILEEQVNPELLTKDINQTVKSQILVVDNMYKFFDMLRKGPLQKTSLGSTANYFINDDLEKLSEELNSMYGKGKASGVSGLLRRGVGLAQGIAGRFSNAATVKEASIAGAAANLGANIGAGYATAAIAGKLSQVLSQKLEKYKEEEDGIKNVVIDAINQYGLRSTMQVLVGLGKQYGLPWLLQTMRIALANSPMAHALIASLTAGAGVAGLAAGAGVAAAGVAGVAAGGHFLKQRAGKINSIRKAQASIEEFIEEIANSGDMPDFNTLNQTINAYKDDISFNVNNAKKLFGNDIAKLKKAFLDAFNQLKPLYHTEHGK